MKKIILTMMLIFSMSVFALYIPGETVKPEDNLSWTDSDGYSTNIFDEIFLQKNVVVLFYGGFG